MKSSLTKNLLASVVIFLVAIPLNLGIALASGVSPAVGLLSGIIAGIVVGSLAGCPLQVSGPAAGLIAVVWQIVDAHGLAMLGPVVLAAGLLQIALGASRLAPWFRAVCPTVIQGMLAGIGVLIFASQFQVMLDQKPKVSGIENLLALPGAVWEVVAHGSGHPSALIGFLTIAVIVAWSWAPKKIQVVPGSLMGVAAAVLAAVVFTPEITYVQLPGDPFSDLGLVGSEQLRGLLSPAVLGSVLALAFIASAQTLLTATAIDRMHNGPRTDYNREIIAQGCGNTLCGALGLLPVSGVIVRSAANVEAGATGRSSAVLHGVWVALFLLFLSPLLSLVPLPALAAVLVYTGYRLVNVKAIKELKKFGRGGLVIYAATLGTVVMVDLLSGILLGFLLSAARLVYVLTHCTVTSFESEEGVLVLELQGSATFFTLPKLADALASLPPAREVHLFMSGLNHIDHACLEHLMGWEELYLQQGGEVFIEWDHLVKRFKRPLTSELGKHSDRDLRPTREHESFDVLAARARLAHLQSNSGWPECATAVTDALVGSTPEAQVRLIREGLEQQFLSQDFPVVEGAALPHLTIPGMPRQELVVVKSQSPLRTLDPTEQDVKIVIVLVSPPRISDHLNILARLSSRAEEGVAADLSRVDSELEIREALLRHSNYVTVFLEPSRPSAALAGKALWELSGVLPPGSLVALVDRGESSFVPRGNTQLKLGDRILVLGSEAAVANVFSRYVQKTSAATPC